MVRRSDRSDADRMNARYLVNEYGRLLPERVRIARYGALRFDEHGEVPTPEKVLGRWEPPIALELAVVAASEGWVRVVIDQEQVRLIAWVSRRDLVSVVTEPSRLAANAAQEANRQAGGVQIYPGLPIQVRERRDRRVLVEYSDVHVEFHGWMDAKDLGDIYVPVDIDEEKGEGERGLPPATAILDAPNGAPVAQTVSVQHQTHPITLLGDAPSGHAFVSLSGQYYRVHGYVSRAVIVKPSPFYVGSATSPALPSSASGMYSLVLPVGACLRARRGGGAVGRVVDEIKVSAERVDGWWQVRIPTYWGVFSLWLVEGTSEGCGS
jgi:hypothetical protein